MKPSPFRALLLLLLALAAGCASSGPGHIVYAGGNGLTFNTAVIITRSKTLDQGFAAEQTWLNNHFPGYTQTGQMFVPLGDRRFDVIDFTTADGQHLHAYFDVTEVIRPPGGS
jgi:hypothetical protein